MSGVLKLAAYRRLLSAYTLNELAWSIGSVALAYLVYRRTGSALGAMAFFLTAQFVPSLLSPLLVARLDRKPARRVLPALYGLECVAFLVLAWVVSRFWLPGVLALALADGICALTARSLARATTVAVTSAHGLLREGNAVSNTAFSVCFTVGPALGGAVVAAGGASAALLGVSCIFALIVLTLITASGLPGASESRGSAVGRVRAALAHARARPAIRRLLGLQAVALLFFTISIPVEVVFAEHSLHAGAGGYGGLLSAWGGGAVAGSAIYARWRGLASRSLIALGAASLGLGFLVMAAAPSLAVAIVGSALAGLGNGVEAVSARTALQEQVEQDWMALMMSLNESMFQTLPGAGILLGGGIAALSSPRVALAVAGGGAVAVTAAAWSILRDDRPPPSAEPSSPAAEAAGRRSDAALPASAARHQ